MCLHLAPAILAHLFEHLLLIQHCDCTRCCSFGRQRGALNQGKFLEYNEYCAAHIYAATELVRRWAASKSAAKKVDQLVDGGNDDGPDSRKEQLWNEIVAETRARFPACNWVDVVTNNPRYKAFPVRRFLLQSIE